MRDRYSHASYAHGVFNIAVWRLATGAGPLPARLHDAWMHFHPASVHDMPTSECRELFTQIKEGLTGAGPLMEKDGETVGVGSIDATLLGMSPERGVEIAEWITQLDDLLESWCRANDPNPIPPHLLDNE